MHINALYLSSVVRLAYSGRGHSSVGRAPALQAGGRRFDPVWLHQFGWWDRAFEPRQSRPGTFGAGGWRRASRARALNGSFVRNKFEHSRLRSGSDFGPEPLVLSDIVKRRSIRASRVTSVMCGAQSPFGDRETGIRNQDKVLIPDVWRLMPEMSAHA